MHGSTETATAGSPSYAKSHRFAQRPPFEYIALLLQGGGALGSNQPGVYEALAGADLHPDWVAEISIDAINSAIIAGNPLPVGEDSTAHQRSAGYVIIGISSMSLRSPRVG